MRLGPRRPASSAPGHATGTRTRVRAHPLLPDRHSWVDIAFTFALAGVALSAFGSSFTGTSYLVVGLLGALLAVVVTHLARAAGWPTISAVVICVVLFFLLGGPLCLRSLGDTSLLPGASTMGRVADQAVFGWKDLLTTQMTTAEMIGQPAARVRWVTTTDTSTPRRPTTR